MLPRRALLLPLLGLATAAPAHAAAPDPWPTMRHDARNTGASELVWRPSAAARPWRHVTGRGVFSTPVVGADGTTFVGSADGRFSALDGRGRPRWTVTTGGLIDAGAALDAGGVTFGSGDELLRRVSRTTGAPIWQRKPSLPLVSSQKVQWWEGSVARGPDGTLYAGSTGGGAYAFSAGGAPRWAVARGNAVWTAPAIGPDGTTYWGSLDLAVFAVDAAGGVKWSTGTLGYITGSPALGRDGTLYATSFDGRLLALDAATGKVRWTFLTRSHVYASPALVEDATGTRLVVVASTDGTIYGIGSDGRERWRYDTLEPVRASPAVGRVPGGGHAVYVGGGDGKLHVLDAATGRQRFAYDLTSDQPGLRDRNDLNGSPALGVDGAVVGGEDGSVSFVPYGWCERHADRRCDRRSAERLPRSSAVVAAVTPGGGLRVDGDFGTVPSATVATARLIVRRGGRTLAARWTRTPSIRFSPALPGGVDCALSGDGRDLVIRPRRLLSIGATYRVRVAGAVSEGGATRRAAGELVLRVAEQTAPKRDALRLGGLAHLRLERLALPTPAFLTSVNQIGFDAYTLDLDLVRASTDGRLTMRGRSGGRTFTLTGRQRGRTVALRSNDAVLPLSFADVPVHRLDLRFRLDPTGGSRSGASLEADVRCADVPGYSVALRFVGLCNTADVLVAAGTFELRKRSAGATAAR